MDSKLQRRIQRYGWDLAASDYEPLWQAQLVPVHRALMQMAAFNGGEHVLDVACGTGLLSFEAAGAVGPRGLVTGVDLSGSMVLAAQQRVTTHGLHNIAFSPMDAQSLMFPTGSFDTVVCALGLMYLPEPAQALREMQRVLRPGGRVLLAVWGEQSHCGWASVMPIVADEVATEVCPLFFELGAPQALTALCRSVGLQVREERRISTTLDYRTTESACDAVFTGGPVALAWSRFDRETRERVRRRYAESVDGWRHRGGYAIPAEFVAVLAENL